MPREDRAVIGGLEGLTLSLRGARPSACAGVEGGKGVEIAEACVSVAGVAVVAEG